MKKGILSFESWKLNESLSSAREKFLRSGFVDQETFDRLKALDPTPTFKYLDKIIDFYLKDRPSATDMMDAVSSFHDLSSKGQIDKKDINSYKNWKEFLHSVESARGSYGIKQETKVKKKDFNVIYRDAKHIVVMPFTHEASCKYGAGTKWCTASVSPIEYDSYAERGATLYYIIDTTEKQPRLNSLYKIAVTVYPDGSTECVDARDNDIEFEEVLYFTGLDASLFKPMPGKLKRST